MTKLIILLLFLSWVDVHPRRGSWRKPWWGTSPSWGCPRWGVHMQLSIMSNAQRVWPFRPLEWKGPLDCQNTVGLEMTRVFSHLKWIDYFLGCNGTFLFTTFFDIFCKSILMFSGRTLTSSQHRGTTQMRNPSAPQQTGVPVPEGVPRRMESLWPGCGYGPKNQILGPIAAMVVCVCQKIW